MVVFSDALPHRLLASQVYFPASLMLIFEKKSTFPLVFLPLLSLIQTTVGAGIPVAWHDRLKEVPSINVLSCISSMDEVTVNEKEEMFLVA